MVLIAWICWQWVSMCMRMLGHFLSLPLSFTVLLFLFSTFPQSLLSISISIYSSHYVLTFPSPLWVLCEYSSPWCLLPWYFEERFDGVHLRQWWVSVCQLYGSDAQRPHITAGIIRVVILLFTCYHLHTEASHKSWCSLCQWETKLTNKICNAVFLRDST